MIKKFLIKILIRLIKVPVSITSINKEKEEEMFWGLYPLKEFRDYVSRRDMQILQTLGEGVSRDDYQMYLGQRIELGMLLRTAKQAFDKVDATKKHNK